MTLGAPQHLEPSSACDASQNAMSSAWGCGTGRERRTLIVFAAWNGRASPHAAGHCGAAEAGSRATRAKATMRCRTAPDGGNAYIANTEANRIGDPKTHRRNFHVVPLGVAWNNIREGDRPAFFFKPR